MSYEILYGKQFIKVNDKNYCPIVIMGSNNCYDVYNRREREWWNWGAFLSDGKLFGTKEEILSNMKNYRDGLESSNDDYSDERFGYFTGLSMVGKHTSDFKFSQLVSFYNNGFKNALTIEELNAKGFNVQVRSGYSYKDELPIKTIKVNSTEELLEAISEIKEYTEGTKVSTVITYGKNVWHYFQDRKWENIQKRNSAPKKLKTKELNEVFVLVDGGKYFAKSTKYGYKYSFGFSAYSTKKFTSKSLANKKLSELNAKGYNFEIELVKLDKPILV